MGADACGYIILACPPPTTTTPGGGLGPRLGPRPQRRGLRGGGHRGDWVRGGRWQGGSKGPCQLPRPNTLPRGGVDRPRPHVLPPYEPPPEPQGDPKGWGGDGGPAGEVRGGRARVPGIEPGETEQPQAQGTQAHPPTHPGHKPGGVQALQAIWAHRPEATELRWLQREREREKRDEIIRSGPTIRHLG